MRAKWLSLAVGIPLAEEFVEFVEGLTNAQFEELQKFFETAPSLSHTFSVINPNTGKESEFIIEGLASFFG